MPLASEADRSITALYIYVYRVIPYNKNKKERKEKNRGIKGNRAKHHFREDIIDPGSKTKIKINSHPSHVGSHQLIQK